jgi:hypothetical protein
MNIIIEPPVSDYYIVQVDVTDAMLAEDPWGREWFPEIEAWCHQTLGQQDMWGEPVVTGWKRMRNKFFFADEDMLTMFKLVWGGPVE